MSGVDTSVTNNKQEQELTSGGASSASRKSPGASVSKSSLHTPTVISQASTTSAAKQSSTRISSGIPSAAPHKPHSTVGRTLSGPTAAPQTHHSTVVRTLSGPTAAPQKYHSAVSRTFSGPSEATHTKQNSDTKQNSECKNSSIPSRISRPSSDSVVGRNIHTTKNKSIDKSAIDNKVKEKKTCVNQNEKNSEKSNVNRIKTKCNINVNKDIINNLKCIETEDITESREKSENKNNENVDLPVGDGRCGTDFNDRCDLKVNLSENKNKRMSCMTSSNKTVIPENKFNSNMINNLEINSNQPLSGRTDVDIRNGDKAKPNKNNLDNIDVDKSGCENNDDNDIINNTENPNLSSESEVILKHELEINEKEIKTFKSNNSKISVKETKIPMKKVSIGPTSKIPSAMQEQKDKFSQSRKIDSVVREEDYLVKDIKCEHLTDNIQERESRPRERKSDKKMSQNNLSKFLMTKDKSSEIQRSFLKFPNTQLRSRSPRNKDEVHHKCVENEENRKSQIDQPKNDFSNEKQLRDNTKEIMFTDNMPQDTVDTKSIPKIPLNGHTSKLSRQCELYEKEKQMESQNHETKRKSSHRESLVYQADESMEHCDLIRISNEEQAKKSQTREPSLSKMEFKDHNIGSHRDNIALHLDLRKTSEMQYVKKKPRSREPSLPKTESREMSKLTSLTENLTDSQLPGRSQAFDSYQHNESINKYDINSQAEFKPDFDIESRQIMNSSTSQSPECKLEYQSPVRTPSPRHDITYRVHETQRKKRPRSCETINSRNNVDNKDLNRMSVPSSKSFEHYEYHEPLETQLLRKEIESRTELLKLLNQQNNRKSRSRDSSETKTYRREACHLPLQRQTADVVRIPDQHQSKNSSISEPVQTLQEFQEALRHSQYKNDFEPCNDMLRILNQQSKRRSRSCEPPDTQNEHRSNKEEIKYPFESARSKVSTSPSDTFDNNSSIVKECKKDIKTNLKEYVSRITHKVKDSHSTNDNIWESRNSCDSIISKEDSRHSPEEIGMESFGRQALTSFQELPILNGLSHSSNDKRKSVENRNLDNVKRYNKEIKSLESDYQQEQRVQDYKSQLTNDPLKRSRTPDSFSEDCISRDSTIDSGLSDKQRSGLSSDCSPIQGWPPHQSFSLESKAEGEWSFRRSEAKPNSISLDRMHLNLPKIQVCGEEVNTNEDFTQPDNLVIEKKESRVSKFVRMFNRKEAESTSRSSSRERRPRLGRSPNRMLGMCLQAPGQEIEGDPRWQRRNSKGDFYSLSDDRLDRKSDSLRSDSSNGVSERKSRRNSKGEEDNKIRWWKRGESVDCSGRKSVRSESLCDKQKQRVIRGDSNSLDDGRNREKDIKPRSPSQNPTIRKKSSKVELFAYFDDMRGRQRNNKEEPHSFRSSSCTPLGRNSVDHNGKESGGSGDDSLPSSLLEPEENNDNQSKNDSLGNGLLKRYKERRRSSGEWARSLKTRAKEGNGVSQNPNINADLLKDSNETDPSANHLYKKFYSHCVILPLKKKKKESTSFVEMINHKSLNLYSENPRALDCHPRVVERRASLDSLCKDLEKSKMANAGSEIKHPNPYASVESIDRNHPVIDDLLSEILENVSMMEKDLKESNEWKRKDRSIVESGEVTMEGCDSESETMTLGEFFRGGVSHASSNHSRIKTLISKYEPTDSS